MSRETFTPPEIEFSEKPEKEFKEGELNNAAWLMISKARPENIHAHTAELAYLNSDKAYVGKQIHALEKQIDTDYGPITVAEFEHKGDELQALKKDDADLGTEITDEQAEIQNLKDTSKDQEMKTITVHPEDVRLLQDIMENPNALQEVKSRMADLMEHGGSSSYMPGGLINTQEMDTWVKDMKQKVKKIEVFGPQGKIDLWENNTQH